MTRLEVAQLADLRDLPLESIVAYEAVLVDMPASLNIYLDLAAIYVQCADFGYVAAKGLPDYVVEDSYSNAQRTVLNGRMATGDQLQTQFWLEYVDYVILGQSIPLDSARGLAARGVAEASAYLYSVTLGLEGGDIAAQLLKWVRLGRTCRERRWRSILTSRSLPPLPLTEP